MKSHITGQAQLIGPCRSPEGIEGIGAIVKRTLSFRDRREMPIEIRRTPLHDGDILLADADGFAPHKPCCDVTVAGSAYSASPVAHVAVSVEVGPARKRLRVHGERRLRLRGDSVHLEQVAPFHGERLLGYAEAYGGHLGERRRPRRGAFGARESNDLDPDYHIYPRNSAGRGFFTRERMGAIDGSLAPSQEVEDDPIAASRIVRVDEMDWPSAPLAGHFGPIATGWFPRVQWLFPFSQSALAGPLAEDSLCGLTEQDRSRAVGAPDARALSCAAPGLAVFSLDGMVPVTLTGFRWGNGLKRFTVDVSSPRVRLAFPNAGSYDVLARLKTFAIDADREEISLVWGGFQPTAMRYRDEDLNDVNVEVRNA